MEQEVSALHKKLVSSVIELLVLQIVKERPLYGNRILKQLNKRFGVAISPAKLYSTLGDMEKRGWIDGRRGNIPYQLTDQGQAMRSQMVENYQNLTRSIESILVHGFYIDAFRMA